MNEDPFLQADCVLRAFAASGKRHLLVTGGRGSGKSTLAASLVSCIPPGITTRAIPMDRVILSENGTDRETVIGLFDPAIQTSENRMRLRGEGFSELGVPALQRCIAGSSEWLFIDEIGYLEGGCEEYLNALSDLMEHKRLLAVVRSQNLPHLRQLLDRQDVFCVNLDQPFGNVSCVIMASGMGTRFGGNKVMADFLGRPLLERTLTVTQDVFSHRVVVTRNRDTADFCEKNGVDVLLHDQPDRNDTVRLGLEAVGRQDGCIFCQADQPLVTETSLRTMALCAAADREGIFRLSYDGVGGSPVLFSGRYYDELCALPKGKGGSALFSRYPDKICLVPAGSVWELRDVDTPENLAELERYAKIPDSCIAVKKLI